VGGLLGVGGGQDRSGPGQDVEPEVAALLGPFVVLFGQYGADQADDGVAVGAPLSSSGDGFGVWLGGVVFMEVVNHGSVHDRGEVAFQASSGFGWALSFGSFARQ
jgi:hypothetical protein